jgi:flagellar hook-associated protein 3 FlgL
MTISTSYLFDRALGQMTDLQTRISKAQDQLATGKLVVSPSDDPEKISVMQRLKSALNRQDSYANTLQAAGVRLNAQENAVRNSSTILVRIKELALQASSDTMNGEDRTNIASEIEGLQKDLLSLANTTDVNGNFVFGGSRVSTAPFSVVAGIASYQGDQADVQAEAGDQRKVQISRPGSAVFAGTIRADSGERVGFFQVLEDLKTAINDSTYADMHRGLDELDKLQSGFSQAMVQIGTELNVVENQTKIIDDTRIQLQTTLSQVQDTDYTEAITRLQKEMLGLQAAQSSFAKTADLNLFNYIR